MVDFVLVTMVLLPLVLGILHVALVLHVRNTLTAAASEAARQAAASGAEPDAGASYAEEQIAGALNERFAREVTSRAIEMGGAPAIEVRITAEVPPLGLWGPSVDLVVEGHAIREQR